MKTAYFTKTQFVKVLILNVLLVCFSINIHTAETAISSNQERPNFIIINIDDWRFDALGCTGNDIIQTPVMDNLVKNGVYFKNAFVDEPCNISHKGTLTGVHARTHGYQWFEGPMAHAYTDASFPQLLHDAGYHTALIGKVPSGFEAGALDMMFDTCEKVMRRPYMIKVNGKERQSSQYIVDKAIDFLREYDTGQPLSLSIAFNDAHADDDVLRQYWWDPSIDHLYRDVKIPELNTSTTDLAFIKSMPEYLYVHFNRQRWWQRYRSPETYQEMMKGYYRVITGVDMAIGRLLDELKKSGRDKNTVVIIMGENGVFVGERGFGGKYLLYEPSIRTPFIIYNPQSPESRKGIILEQMVLNLDIAPTILEFAGIENPGLMYGSSLIPLMNGEQAKWRTGFLCQHLSKADPSIIGTVGYRTEQWKYLRYVDFENSEELYDLLNDPNEENNLSETMRYQKQLVELRNRCNQEIEKLLSEKKNPKPSKIIGPGY